MPLPWQQAFTVASRNSLAGQWVEHKHPGMGA